MPLVDPKIAGAVLFVASYAAIIRFKGHKSHVLWIAIGLCMILGLVSARDIVHDINWNVMGIFAGTLLLAEFFIASRVPDAVAAFLVRRSSNVGAAFLSVCFFASFLSAFIENVAVVLIVAPIALELAKRMRVSPVPVMIGIAIVSNLQGTATLIGDPPSMILANYQKMNFNDFFFYHGKPGIFFAVEAGAIGSMIILFLLFRKYRKPLYYTGREEVHSFVPTALLVVMVAGLAMATLVDPGFLWFGGALCMTLGLASFFIPSAEWIEKKIVLKQYDWGTTAFLAGVFVMVGMLERAGIIEHVAAFLGAHLGDNPALTFLIVVWGSVALSAFIDNVPYITTMIPVVQKLSAGVGIAPELLLFGLLIGACLGGNITPVGASANVVATGILKKHGHVISFREFMRIGLPFTIVATAIGTAFIYWVWR